MEYKIYLDYTIELLSQIKIPSYIIDTPYIWDNQIDGSSAPIAGIILHYLYMTAFHVNIYILSFQTVKEYS